MREYDIHERENEITRAETIIKKVCDHSSDQMMLCYIGESANDSLD